MTESSVSRGLVSYFSVLAQLGKGRMFRTNTFKGKVQSHYENVLLVDAIKRGDKAEALRLATSMRSMNTGEEGLHDFTGIVTDADGKGIFAGVESKRPGGVRSPEQVRMAALIESLGGISVTAEHYADAANVFSKVTGHPFHHPLAEDGYDYSKIPF